MKKICFGVAAVLVMLSLSVGCSGKKEEAAAAAPSGPSGTVTLHYWGEEQQAGMENIVTLFKRAKPEINLEITLIPGRDPYYARLQASLPAGTGPDIMWHNSNIADFLNYLYTLDELIPGSGIDLSKFPKVIVDFYTYGGKLYAIPKDFDTIAVFYNKALFDAAGVPYPQANWTWEDLRQTAAKLTTADVYGFAADWNDSQVGFGNFVRQQRGGPISTGGNTVNVNDASIVEALEFIRQLMYTDKVAIDGNAIAETNASDLFMSDRAAMISHGSWKVGPFYDAMTDKLGVVELPAGRQKGGQINGLGYALNKGTKNFDAAFEVLKFLATKEGQAATARVVIPAYEGAADEWIAAYPSLDLRVFLDSVANAYTEAPYAKNSRATNALFIDYISAITMDPAINIKAELDKAQAEMIESIK